MSTADLPAPAAFAGSVAVTDVSGTHRLAARVAALLQGGEALLLHGFLGAGKTAFVQGLCAALGVAEEVTSPTFTLANRYTGRLVVHHLDFYRIASGADLADIGVEAVLDDLDAGGAILVAEWPGLLVPLLPRRIELLVSPLADPDARLWLARGAPALPAAFAEIFSFPPPAPEGTSCSS